MDLDESDEESQVKLVKKWSYTKEERLKKTSKGRMERVVERMKLKNSEQYREVGAGSQALRESKLSLKDRANEMVIATIPDKDFVDLNVEDKLLHMSKNIGTAVILDIYRCHI